MLVLKYLEKDRNFNHLSKIRKRLTADIGIISEIKMTIVLALSHTHTGGFYLTSIKMKSDAF